MQNYPSEYLEKYPASIDLEKRAKSRMPHLSWEYLQCGTGDEHALSRNRHAFKDIILTPRPMQGAVVPDLSVELLGQRYGAPFGIAPVGLTGLMWPRAEHILAQAAARYSIPYCLSTVATETPETIGPLVGNMGWFQLYPPKEKAIRADILSRAKNNGFHTLVVTADVPVPSRRERTKRAGLRMPHRMTPRMIFDIFTHPSWTFATLRNGSPRLKTIEKYTDARSKAAVAEYVNSNLGGTFSWDYFKELRDEWTGTLILKGLTHPADAETAVELGADGIIVSNHGGRQFDAIPAAISVLPEIVRSVKGKTHVLFDSGIRSGLDIIKAISLGADFVFLGRTFIYGVAALGKQGGAHTCEMLIDELKNCMIQLGCTGIDDLKKIRE